MNKKIKNILLVGGSSKLGLSIIENLDPKKYNVYSTYYKNKILNKFNNKINQFKIDLSDNKKINLFLKKIKVDFDIVFFLQGELHGKPLKKFSIEEISRNINVNFTSQSIILKSLVQRQKRNCLIIFISSISAVKGSYDPIYAASKGATLSLVKSISKWEAPKIKCIGLLPGTINKTKMYYSLPIKKRKLLLTQVPNKELLNTDDLAKIVLDLTQPHWRHANGSIIIINGGLF